jgi:hypothetical protein
MKQAFHFTVLTVAIAALSAATAPVLKNGTRILFIGNSYAGWNGCQDDKLREFCLDADTSMAIVASRILTGNQTLYGHSQTPTTVAMIDTGRWDLVVLQGQSDEPVLQPDSFFLGARLLDAHIRAANAKTAFYMTWPETWEDLTMPHVVQDSLGWAYDSIGRELGAIVVPVGRAFEIVRNQYPPVHLYPTNPIGWVQLLYDDTGHPNPVGRALCTYMFYAMLAEKSPVGVQDSLTLFQSDFQSLPSVRVALPDTCARYLQGIAWAVASARLGIGVTREPVARHLLGQHGTAVACVVDIRGRLVSNIAHRLGSVHANGIFVVRSPSGNARVMIVRSSGTR